MNNDWNKWDFGPINRISNIGDPEMERLGRENYLETFARELIQNSIDANSNEKPTIVKFTLNTKTNKNDSIYESTRQITQNIDKLDSDSKKSYEYNIKSYNLKNLKTSNTPYLIIEDFNTHGLIGNLNKSTTAKSINDEKAKGHGLHNARFAFLNSTGTNAKGNHKNSGGTWGVGKSTLIGRSLIKTIMVYSVIDESYQNKENNIPAHFFQETQLLSGRTKQPYFVDNENNHREGEATWGDKDGKSDYTTPVYDKNKINTWLENISNLKRKSKSPGTSIFIPYPLNNKDQKLSQLDEISESIKSNYMYKILNEELECEFWINDKKIQELDLNKKKLLELLKSTAIELRKNLSVSQKDVEFLQLGFLINKFINIKQNINRQNNLTIQLNNKDLSKNNSVELRNKIKNQIISEYMGEMKKTFEESTDGEGQKSIFINVNINSEKDQFGKIEVLIWKLEKENRINTYEAFKNLKKKNHVLRNFMRIPLESNKIQRYINSDDIYCVVRIDEGEKELLLHNILANTENEAHKSFLKITKNRNSNMIDIEQKFSKSIWKNSIELYDEIIKKIITDITNRPSEDGTISYEDSFFRMSGEKIYGGNDLCVRCGFIECECKEVYLCSNCKKNPCECANPLPENCGICESDPCICWTTKLGQKEISIKIERDRKSKSRNTFVYKRKIDHKSGIKVKNLRYIKLSYGVKRNHTNNMNNLVPLEYFFDTQDIKNQFSVNDIAIANQINRFDNNKRIHTLILKIDDSHVDQNLYLKAELPNLTRVNTSQEVHWGTEEKTIYEDDQEIETYNELFINPDEPLWQ